MKLTYKKRIFFCFVLIFAIFAACIIYAEQEEERKYKTESLESKLDGYAELIHEYMLQNNLNDSNIVELRKLMAILPVEIRATVIKPDGKVSFDKEVVDVSSLDNHMNRPEILQAQYQSFGTHVRMSASTQHEYIYYAKRYPTYFMRVALPYDVKTKNLLKPDNLFIYIVVGLFLGVLLLLNYVAGRFGKSISQLKRFTSIINLDKPLPQNIHFPDDELGDIGRELIDIFEQKERSKQTIEMEREKFIRHFRFSEEGIGIFSPDCKQTFSNIHFIQYLNFIMDKPVLNAKEIFEDETFASVRSFITDKNRKKNHDTYQINKNGKIFNIQTLIFDDTSFEVTIRDVTKAEKTRLLKQEMTNNIAHELRTPVTSLRGYLETLNEKYLPEEKQSLFINRAYLQSIRLSNLIEDVSLLSKIEEPSSRFPFEKIDLLQIINEVRIDLTDNLIRHNISLFISVKDNLLIDGNQTLLYSIFRNLIDNSISYAGENTEIHINNYLEDENFVYISYYDTGHGVAQEHLNRLFERFYRVNEGRTRDTGGSGLGLSIVRNAVLLHKGEIQVKNKTNAGLEFLFTLKK